MIVQTVAVGACTPQTIVIGRRGTYDTLQIVFDLSYLIENYGSGTAVLAVKRSQDESAYPAVVTQEDNTLTWTVSETDTYYVGSGECQLMWYVDGGLAKTIIYPMVVMRDILSTTEEPPDGYENWIEHLTELGAETQQNAQNAAQSASDASTAKNDAVTAKEAAEAAQRAAETAVTHYPTIQNNYWMVWDSDTQQYVSTGIQAEGEDGYSPEVTIVAITGGHRVTITDKDHPQGQSFDVMDGQGGGGGTSDYTELSNKPKINNVELDGNKTAHDLGLAAQSDIPTVPVQSVNGKTGAVNLASGDIAYDESATYQAGSVGAELSDLSRQLSDIEENQIPELKNAIDLGCITAELKTALLQLASKVVYIDADGQDYYDDLYAALYYRYWTVTNTLDGCITNNASDKVIRGSPYSATITPTAGHVSTGATVIILMGGVDITSIAYNNGTITIAAVTGDLSISVTMPEPTVTSITAVFNPGFVVILDTDDLFFLRQYLTVTATYIDSSSSVVTDYTLSGTLTAGTSTITASYEGETATFSVEVHNRATETQWAAGYNSNNTSNSRPQYAPFYIVGNNYNYGTGIIINSYALNINNIGTLSIGYQDSATLEGDVVQSVYELSFNKHETKNFTETGYQKITLARPLRIPQGYYVGFQTSDETAKWKYGGNGTKGFWCAKDNRTLNKLTSSSLGIDIYTIT